MKINHTLIDELIKFCVDFECIMSLIDRKHLIVIKSNAIIHRINNFIKVRNINHRLHNNFEYIELNFYVSDKLFDDSSIIIYFKREIHIVDDFRINVLLKVNIINFEKITLNLNNRTFSLFDCDNFQTSLDIIFKNHRIIRAVRSIILITISSHIYMTIFIKIRDNNLFENRDYSFESKQDFQILNSKNEFFNHITNVNVFVVQIQNVSNKSYFLFKNAKVNMLRDYERKKLLQCVIE